MSCLWHPTRPGLVITGSEDTTLHIWDPKVDLMCPVVRFDRSRIISGSATTVTRREEKREENKI